VIIRDATAEDATQIDRLRWDPRLRGMQYAPSVFEISGTYMAAAQPGPDIPAIGFKCSTILVDSGFAGNISEGCSMGKNGVLVIQLGWNLRPEFWGQGFMVQALEQLFQKRFATRSDIEFVACAFTSNRRSIRVIEKLGFLADRMSLSERILHFYMSRGMKRVAKFRLPYGEWCKRRQSP